MIMLPRAQMMAIAAFLAAALAVSAYVIRPLVIKAVKTVREISVVYRQGGDDELAQLQYRLDSLENVLAGVDTLAADDNTPVRWYACLEECVNSAGIRAERITASGQGSFGRIGYVDYEFGFAGTYHAVGRLVSDLENGPFVCGVRNIRLAASSLVSNRLQGTLRVRFYRSLP